nr:MAG TPA: hypothetical protein [Caudoviricetes sp.]
MILTRLFNPVEVSKTTLTLDLAIQSPHFLIATFYHSK